MGASRKLQGEIDRVLTMVQEGVVVFDSIWNKVFCSLGASRNPSFKIIECVISSAMGASRKLQGEIDRVLKKVQEGVVVFDIIWNKVFCSLGASRNPSFKIIEYVTSSATGASRKLQGEIDRVLKNIRNPN